MGHVRIAAGTLWRVTMRPVIRAGRGVISSQSTRGDYVDPRLQSKPKQGWEQSPCVEPGLSFPCCHQHCAVALDCGELLAQPV